ncbi:CDP-diacylglycerol--inositol 3-phosphatidyltransferase [Atractiella rhizophila]|nr:CDP-diacylglycerol--inositol 3-phosphatidyltransferase [Atractiella rhizophila]
MAKPNKRADPEAVVEGKTDENIFLFVPNLIGYTRILLAAVSLYYMSYHPKYCTIAYCVSCLLDAVDGQAARYLGQTSQFGAVLDMVTDRCTTSCLLCFLSSAYPSYALLFQALITLDFSSHYIHMYSSLRMGSNSHKTVSASHSRILRSYYTNNVTLFIFCAGNELFFVCLYLLSNYQKPIGFKAATIIPYLPVGVLKAVPGVVWGGLELITWPMILALVTFPICIGKQMISAIQFWKASKALVEIDRADRWRARMKK